ncbi:MAG TPA: hypothetical protein VEB42_08925, partial [Chitinophagaceae bacterium]|nr:hypothetical protein [Chitinophagaceae bacterium]
MKNLPLNEKHLADKLRNVPVPDVDQSWEQMRKLLDRDQPEPVAGAWSGNGKWWWMGITAAVVMIAAWLANPFREGEQRNNLVVEKTEAKVASATKKAPVTRAAGNDKTTTFNKTTKTLIAKTSTQKTKAFITKKTSGQTTGKVSLANRLPILNSPVISASGTEIDPSSVNPALVSTGDLIIPANNFIKLQNNQPSRLAVSGKTDKAFVREMRKRSMKDDNRRLSRASMRGNSRENVHELTFAAGLALPQSFAISGQQAANYNIAAKSSRITDYLPAPYFQYHLNDKVFLQTEFHFQSPQYTQRLLLSQSIQTLGNSKHETSQHLEKLYYFNIPFNVYYSPARNFYIGGGLQYSSLLGGVATYEDKRSEGSNVVSYTAVTTRFKDDSAAAVFRPSEWRYQFDASYYFNRFSLGMRYNQAMKDFI